MIVQVTYRLHQFPAGLLCLLDLFCLPQLFSDGITEHQHRISPSVEFHCHRIPFAVRHIADKTAAGNYDRQRLPFLSLIKHAGKMALIGILFHILFRIKIRKQPGPALLHLSGQIIERLQRTFQLFLSALRLHKSAITCRGDGFEHVILRVKKHMLIAAEHRMLHKKCHTVICRRLAERSVPVVI